MMIAEAVHNSKLSYREAARQFEVPRMPTRVASWGAFIRREGQGAFRLSGAVVAEKAAHLNRQKKARKIHLPECSGFVRKMSAQKKALQDLVL
jgi:hypothetical protein